jgi:HicA toxin of bacterial toxin-antitoxin,
MKRKDVEKALRQAHCHVERQGARHTIWRCPCGKHVAPVPRHSEVTAGVVGAIGKEMACLAEGWLG